MDNNTVLQSLAGGAIITAALTFARLLLEYGSRNFEKRAEHVDRQRQQQRDAEARLERILQDRLAEADRRLDRLQQNHESLIQHYANLQAEHELLCRRSTAALPTGTTGALGAPGAIVATGLVDPAVSAVASAPTAAAKRPARARRRRLWDRSREAGSSSAELTDETGTVAAATEHRHQLAQPDRTDQMDQAPARR